MIGRAVNRVVCDGTCGHHSWNSVLGRDQLSKLRPVYWVSVRAQFKEPISLECIKETLRKLEGMDNLPLLNLNLVTSGIFLKERGLSKFQIDISSKLGQDKDWSDPS